MSKKIIFLGEDDPALRILNKYRIEQIGYRVFSSSHYQFVPHGLFLSEHFYCGIFDNTVEGDITGERFLELWGDLIPPYKRILYSGSPDAYKNTKGVLVPKDGSGFGPLEKAILNVKSETEKHEGVNMRYFRSEN